MEVSGAHFEPLFAERERETHATSVCSNSGSDDQSDDLR